jgi:hypothetical protein
LGLGFARELRVFDDWRPLEEQLLGGGMLKAFAKTARAKDGAHFVEIHLLTDIEQEQADCRAA